MKWRKITLKQLSRKFSWFHAEVLNLPVPDVDFYSKNDVVFINGDYYICEVEK